MRISDWSSDVCSSDLAFELVAERTRVRIVRKRRILPRRAARRQVAGHAVEAGLHFRIGQVSDQLPRGVLVLRIAERDDAGAAGNRLAGALRPRQRHRHPRIGPRRRQSLWEYGSGPGAVDVESDSALATRVPTLDMTGFAP